MAVVARVLCCALCVGVSGCGSDVIEHGVLDPVDPSATSAFPEGGDEFGEIDGGTMSGAGNFPEPALTRCGDLGEDINGIEDLRASWAVIAVGGTQGHDGEVEPGTIRLRLGDWGIDDCQAAFASEGWSFAITLAPSEATIGIHEFTTLFAPDLELVQEGEPIGLPIAGTIRLVRVTQDCVVGVLSSVTLDGAPVPELSGGFAAEVCTRNCLPTPTHGC